MIARMNAGLAAEKGIFGQEISGEAAYKVRGMEHFSAIGKGSEDKRDG